MVNATGRGGGGDYRRQRITFGKSRKLFGHHFCHSRLRSLRICEAMWQLVLRCLLVVCMACPLGIVFRSFWPLLVCCRLLNVVLSVCPSVHHMNDGAILYRPDSLFVESVRKLIDISPWSPPLPCASFESNAIFLLSRADLRALLWHLRSRVLVCDCSLLRFLRHRALLRDQPL